MPYPTTTSLWCFRCEPNSSASSYLSGLFFAAAARFESPHALRENRVRTRDLEPEAFRAYRDGIRDEHHAFLARHRDVMSATAVQVAAAEPRAYATPRRLAVLISSVLEKQPDRLVERKGPACATALDAAGRPTPALIGFAKSCGVCSGLARISSMRRSRLK